MAEDGGEVPRRSGIAQQFRESSDYLQFIIATLPLARGGNAEAQFYIATAMRFCRREYRAYFWDTRADRRRTLEQGLQHAAVTFGYSMTDAKEIFAKCDALMQTDVSDFGNEEAWLAASAEGGYALAQVTYAQDLMLVQAAPLSDLPFASVYPQAGRREALEYLHRAVRSKDPAVLWEIGQMNWSGAQPDEESEVRRWAWVLMACTRGADCSAQAPWTRYVCRFDPHCQPHEGTVDLIRRMAGGDFWRIEQDARELSARLDANDWSHLGLPEP